MDDAVRNAITDTVDANAAALKELSLYIHANPELGLVEKRAASRLEEFLREREFEMEAGIAGLDTAFRAKAGKGSPVCAFMCEYDALPEIGHGCGHNLIAIAGAGAGVGLKAALGRLEGSVQVLGTPGEEGEGGKVVMVREDVFEGVDFALMAHPSTATHDDAGCSAIKRIAIAFRGRAAHAAGSPEKGANALDAVMLTYNGINALRQHIREDSRIHGVITHGGVKPNIVPEFAEAAFYVRSPEDGYVDELIGKVRNVAQGAALMTGTELDFQETGEGYRSRRPCPVLSRLYREEGEALGLQFKPDPKPSRASSDAGDVSWAVPSIHPYFAIAPEEVASHSKEFAEYSGKGEALEAALKVAKAMALAAARVLENHALLDEMKSEFAKRCG